MFIVFLLKCILFLKSAENLKVSISLQPWRILENSKHNPAMIFDDLYENGNKILHKNTTFKKNFWNVLKTLKNTKNIILY